MALTVAPSPEELRAMLETGFLLHRRGELDEAGEVFDGVLALRPDLEVAQIGLANVRQAAGDDAAAEALFKGAADTFDSAHAHAQLGEFYHTAGRSEEAVTHLDKAIAIDPSGPFGESALAIKALIEDGVKYTYRAPSAG